MLKKLIYHKDTFLFAPSQARQNNDFVEFFFFLPVFKAHESARSADRVFIFAQ